jgi:5'-3' exonuclease
MLKPYLFFYLIKAREKNDINNIINIILIKMGIPYYFYILTKKYNNILKTNIDFKPDIYCIDFNGIIHPVANIYNDDNEIYEELWKKINNYTNIYNPKKMYICVDGVAPLAKIIQQRKRRYLSNYTKLINKEIIKWDTNAITPGTNFMNNLNNYFNNKIRNNTNNTTYYYSGSDINGEGEHKIFHHLKKYNNNINIIINGLDADLIILSLISHKKNIYLEREKNINDNTDYKYVNINQLRIAIINELIIKFELDNNDYNDYYSDISNSLIETYCTMCSLLGNDFIPHLLTLNLKNNGLDELIIFTKNSIKKYGFLIENNQINYKCLNEIFYQLCQKEDDHLCKLNETYINKNIYNSTINSEFYALKNKDIISKQIYSDFKKWKYIYYNNKFYTNIYLDSSLIFKACSNYIKGIYWTYHYYKFNIIDHNWYYPYNFPPIIKDIYNHCQGNKEPIIQNIGNYLDNDIQLLIVLPKSSNNLLNNKLKKYTEDINLGLYHMFPSKFHIHTYLKTHLWECYPELPKININLIKNILYS